MTKKIIINIPKPYQQEPVSWQAGALSFNAHFGAPSFLRVEMGLLIAPFLPFRLILHFLLSGVCICMAETPDAGA